MTARVIIIHDPSSNRPPDDVAHDAINSEIDGEVVVLVIGLDAECPGAEYRLVPKVPGYNKYCTVNAGNRT